jgi:hypothetical protein
MDTSRDIWGQPIAVGTKFHMIWDVDHADTQRSFLGKIDPAYFQYCSDTHAAQLETGNREQAEIALRSNYSHAIECLFSLIGAAIQAPHCPAGWVLLVSNPVLHSLVYTVSKRDVVSNSLGLENLNWPAVVKALHPIAMGDELLEEHINAVERLWRYLASQFCDEDFREEYNSIKHGLRVRSTPWFLNMGTEPSPGQRPATMMRMGGSSAGTDFFRKVKLKENNQQWQLRDGRSNWDAKNFVGLMPLIVRSIANVRALLLLKNGADPSTCTPKQFRANEVGDALAFRALERNTKVSFWFNIDGNSLDDLTQSDIREDYESFFRLAEERG